MYSILSNLFSLLTGYLIGSFLPAYFITKHLKGLDIRDIGTKNAGTTNVKRSVGFWPAVITGLYDTTKGLLAIAIAIYIFNVPETVAYASGFAAILGHMFPFYLNFRGGRGVAAATGMLIVFLIKLSFGLPLHILIGDVVFLAFLALAIYYTTLDENFLSVVFLPVLIALLLIRFRFSPTLMLVLALVCFIFVISAINMKQLKIFTIKSEDFRLWRVMIRPVAVILPILGLFISKKVLLQLTGSVLAFFLAADMFRISWKKAENILEKEHVKGFKIYKAKEKKRISSMTMFLLGVFSSFVFFKYEVAFAVISFSIFGDMMAKIIGINYSRRYFKWGNSSPKTVEGTIGFAIMSVSVAYFLYAIGILPLGAGILGAVIASAVEALPFPVDDNLSVPIISGAVISLILR
ncbi:MAG: glycerol-3-phosphate acyltransferase [Firmicutes bacterium]|nr:glycerol-3-phosphate acyltransferase [Bacillota bacterium]